jgi:SpoVK/Ycf46/Vps4 family AAA+-type ATPase
MIVTLLISKDFDFNNFHNLDVAVKMMDIVSELTETGQAELDIHGQDVDFRFAFLLGTVNGENEWVQRYATLMYRWASLIAKADGTVTAAESSTLASILKMHEMSSGDNVRVSGSVDAMPENNANEIDEDVAVPQKVEEIKLASPTEQKSLKALMCSLDKLIGLAPVKQDVKTLAHFIEIQKKRRQAGLREAPVSYHCVFTGNPGTGKTTVARILADIYREMGVVNKGHLVETDRSGLVAEYVGQTAVKTNKVIDSALDGVLFIDESYTLVQGGNNDYGGEAIATLLKRMEDDRDRLVVILAGYTDEMKRFIDSNPGLHSRFNRYINFPDYSAQELSEIFLLTAAKSQYVCNDDVKASLVQIMERAVQSKDENFGNGRYVRNLFEKAIQRQAVRLSSVAPITTEMLTELTLHDLGFEYED